MNTDQDADCFYHFEIRSYLGVCLKMHLTCFLNLVQLKYADLYFNIAVMCPFLDSSVAPVDHRVKCQRLFMHPGNIY